MVPTRPRGGWLEGHLRAHWDGEYPLALALLVDYLLPAAVTAVGLAALTARMTVDGEHLRVAGLVFALAWPAALALDAWGAVGAWRSARPTGDAGRHLGWAARALIAAAVVATVAVGALQHLPQWWQAVHWVAGADPAGHASLQRSDDGSRWRLSGHLGLGDADRLAPLLTDRSAPRVLELALAGGRQAEARQLAGHLAGQGWLTRITGDCRNACVALFMAGERRQLMPGGRLGFNRQGAEQASALTRWWARRRLAALLAAQGLEPIFVLKAMSTPGSDVWHPGADERERGRFVTRPPRPLDLELPQPASARAVDFADALRANALWNRIEARFPGTLADAGQRLIAARDAGADGPGLQAAAQAVIEPHLSALLFQAGPEVRLAYVQLLAEQISATTDPEACRLLLAGDAAVRRSLPVTLAEREAAWLLDAMLEPARTAAPRRASGPEREVIGRRLGRQAPDALARLRQPSPREAQPCARAAALLAEVLALPPAERKLALRLAFEAP